MRYKNPPDYAEADTDYDDIDVVENPAGVVRTARDERLWSMAKKSAAEQGRARDWPYIMGIFQHMKHRSGSEPVENPANRIRVSPGAYSALEVYVFDPAHIEGGAYDDEGSVETSRDILSSVVPGGLAAPSEDEPQRCWAWHARLSYAAESAAESGDYPAAKALNNLASKCIDPLR